MKCIPRRRADSRKHLRRRLSRPVCCSALPGFAVHRENYPRACLLFKRRAPPMIHSGMAIAAPQTDAGWVSAAPALHPPPMSRTITDGFPGQEAQTWDRSSDPEMRRETPRTALIRRLAKLQQQNGMGQRLSAACLLQNGSS